MIERKTAASKVFYLLIICIVVLFSLSCLLPLIYTLSLSFSSKEAVAAGLVGFWPVGFTTVNYKEIMKDVQFFRSFITAVTRVVLATAISLGVMIPASYALAKPKKEFAPRNIIMWICIFRYLSEIHKPVWIRHVLIPGITDKDEYLNQLRDFLSTLSNIERIDVLPYHTMGIYKYEKLGIAYPLEGIDPPTCDRIAHAEAILQEAL